MRKKETNKDMTPLAALRKRVRQNYADFKADMLMLDEEELFHRARRIANVTDTYNQMTDEGADYLDDYEVTFLLRFHNPLNMVADYLELRKAVCPVEIDEALMELFNDDGHEDCYLTMDFAEELMAKYGDGTRMKAALLFETVEVLERYIRLLKLTDTADIDDCCDGEDAITLFKPIDFDEDGFFIYGDEKEGCF